VAATEVKDEDEEPSPASKSVAKKDPASPKKATEKKGADSSAKKALESPDKKASVRKSASLVSGGRAGDGNATKRAAPRKPKGKADLEESSSDDDPPISVPHQSRPSKEAAKGTPPSSPSSFLLPAKWQALEACMGGISLTWPIPGCKLKRRV